MNSRIQKIGKIFFRFAVAEFEAARAPSDAWNGLFLTIRLPSALNPPIPLARDERAGMSGIERMSVLERLEARGLVHQTTAEDLGAILAAGPVTFYNGYDPTATSLHVGHLLPLTLMKHLQRAGHRVIALIGGGTGLIGDPSGKSAERNLLTAETVMENGRRIHAQVTRLLRAEDNPPLYVNNLDWLGEIRLLDFLRDIGKHFAVNAMVQRDSVKSRFERDGEGISFTEFSYSLLQAYDFLELHKRYGCSLQTGGSDQWGNIVSGTDLIRRMTGRRAFGLTVPLLTDADGKKFGKSENGAIFLDPNLTSPYAFYQFWLNTSDAEAPRLLRLFTDIALEAIDALDTGSGARPAQRLLAEALTRDIHGEEALAGVKKASDALFSGAIQGVPVPMLLEIFADVPSLSLPQAQVANGVALVDLLVATGLTPSKGEARRQIQQGAIRLNGGEAVTGDPVLTASAFIDGAVLVLRRGKKNYGLVKLL